MFKRLLFWGTPFCIILSWPAVYGQEKSALQEVVKRLHASEEEPMSTTQLPSKVRVATWKLMAGELASSPENGLFSEAFDSLSVGIVELNSLLAELENSEKLSRELSDNPYLAIRFDAALTRLAQAEKKRDLSRKEELDRLAQLRLLNRVYRTLLKQLLESQAYAVIGEDEKAIETASHVDESLKQVEQVLSERRDYYLFENEPMLSGSNEIVLLQQIAEPFSNDVRRYHAGLVALTMCREALRSELPDEAALRAAISKADLALIDAPQADPLALFAKGIASLELGRIRTRNELVSIQNHKAAKPLFEQALASFRQVKAVTADRKATAGLAQEISHHIKALESPQYFHDLATNAIEKGNLPEAIRSVEEGLSLHLTEPLVLNDLELRWQAGVATRKEIDAKLRQLVETKVIDSNNEVYLIFTGKIGTAGVWQELGIANNEKLTSEKVDELEQRVELALQDLRTIPSTSKHFCFAQAYTALGELIRLLFFGKDEDGRAIFALQQVGIAAAELEQRATQGASIEKVGALEALQAARLAEGYLALRLTPDGASRSQLAFAAAYDAATSLETRNNHYSLLGSAILESMLNRDDASVERELAEERQLRMILQRALPSLVSSQFRNSESSNSLKEVVDSLTQGTVVRAQGQLEARNAEDARSAALSDLRTTSVIAMVKAGQPDKALTLMLRHWPEFDSLGLDQVRWDKVQFKIETIQEPLTAYALGIALEDYAVEIVKAQSERSTLLALARQAIELADRQLKDMSLWKTRWPYLVDLTQQALSRLMGPEAMLAEAENLRSSLRIAEARAVLASTSLRYPDTPAINRQLALAHFDESQMTTDSQERATHMQKCAMLLEGASLTDEESQLLLAKAYEALGDVHAALEVYERLAETSTNQEVQLRALSRRAALRVQSMSRSSQQPSGKA